MSSRLWFLVHGWVSWPLWGYVAFLCLSGSLAAVSNEVIWLIDPLVRATAPIDGAARLPFGDLAAAVQAHLPGAEIAYARQRTDALAVEFVVWRPDGVAVTALVNPYTAVVQKVSQTLLFQDIVRSLHGWLLMPWQDGYSLGYYAVSVIALPLLVAVLTGMVVYKRFWRGYLAPRLRWRKGGRVFWGDLHRLVGIWSLWFMTITALTGLWFLAQAILWHTHTPYLAEAPELTAATVPLTGGRAARPIPVDQAVAAAQAAVPGLSVRWISWPEHALAPYGVAGSGPNPLFNDRTYGAYVHPWNGEVMAARRSPADLTAVQWIDHLADPLHYGSFGGIISKLVWALFGIALATMALSGMVLWRRRMAAALPMAAPALPVVMEAAE